jgi:hypothetical protein
MLGAGLGAIKPNIQEWTIQAVGGVLGAHLVGDRQTGSDRWRFGACSAPKSPRPAGTGVRCLRGGHVQREITAMLAGGLLVELIGARATMLVDGAGIVIVVVAATVVTIRRRGQLGRSRA